MKKTQTLSALLAEDRAGTSKREANKIALLARWDEIEEALAAGYTVARLWRVMQKNGLVDMNYDNFRKGIVRIRKRKEAATGKSTAVIGKAAVPTGQVARAEPKGSAGPKAKDEQKQGEAGLAAKKGEIKGFKFNPVPNKEELF